ncbi:hypothetical protein OIY81_1508 [Cryptosporidium canis]|uniref:Uncharacterized protein n=1 Tax=Cryptosporidium canis TaxID=195482 RepID=A0ABQ8P2N3_9CRYT|nr:hypothetical protein OJ252_3321 [Cryptosporidium canis]KAJ1611990.1 hypothetical protein OIY81_1508 [Cryptosporidium canis]
MLGEGIRRVPAKGPHQLATVDRLAASLELVEQGLESGADPRLVVARLRRQGAPPTDRTRAGGTPAHHARALSIVLAGIGGHNALQTGCPVGIVLKETLGHGARPLEHVLRRLTQQGDRQAVGLRLVAVGSRVADVVNSLEAVASQERVHPGLPADGSIGARGPRRGCPAGVQGNRVDGLPESPNVVQRLEQGVHIAGGPQVPNANVSSQGPVGPHGVETCSSKGDRVTQCRKGTSSENDRLRLGVYKPCLGVQEGLQAEEVAPAPVRLGPGRGVVGVPLLQGKPVVWVVLALEAEEVAHEVGLSVVLLVN